MNQETPEEENTLDDKYRNHPWKPILEAWTELAIPAVNFIRIVVQQMAEEHNHNLEEEYNDGEETKDSEV